MHAEVVSGGRIDSETDDLMAEPAALMLGMNCEKL